MATALREAGLFGRAASQAQAASPHYAERGEGPPCPVTCSLSHTQQDRGECGSTSVPKHFSLFQQNKFCQSNFPFDLMPVFILKKILSICFCIIYTSHQNVVYQQLLGIHNS